MLIKEGYVVCDNQQKEIIIKSNKGFVDYSFITEEELLNCLTFKIKDSAIFALMNKYNFSYSLAKEYLNAVKYIKDSNYNDPTLDSVVSVYRFLKENNYLEFNELFKIRLAQYPITFVEKRNDKEYLRLVELAKKITTVFEIDANCSNYSPICYQFDTILDESLFIFNQIRDLIKKGVSLNNIYIVNANDDYLFIFKRLARSYRISVNFRNSKSILSSSIVKNFLSLCYESADFNSILSKLDSNDSLYNTIINTINRYSLQNENPNNCISFLTNVFKKISYPSKKYVEAVSFVNNSFKAGDDDYVFYVGFNLGFAPVIYKEEAFLNDYRRQLLGINTSYEINALEKRRAIKFISNTKNLIITYKKYAKTEEYLPSLLIEQLNISVLVGNASFGYAKLEDDLRLSALYDDYLKYGNANSLLTRYGLQDIKYNTYNHKYQKIDQALLDHHFKNKPLKMAYSNAKLFFACPFSYYADRILNLNEFKPQMAARLGTFSHAVLEASYNQDFNFNSYTLEKASELKENAKDEFFFNQMKSFIAAIIDFNRRFEAKASLKNLKFEEHIVVEYQDFSFEGFIDKLMYQIDGNNVYVAIIDYKTGKDIVSLDNIDYGFNFQLPSYMYLISKYPPFKDLNIHIVGIYLQKLNIVVFDARSDIQSELDKNFRLEGYTTTCLEDITRLDPGYENSEYIKSLSFKNNGFGAYSKIFTPDEQKDIIENVEKMIVGAAKNIQNGNYDIKPIMIDGKNKSCTFCKYKDICFCDYNDLVELKNIPFKKRGE